VAKDGQRHTSQGVPAKAFNIRLILGGNLVWAALVWCRTELAHRCGSATPADPAMSSTDSAFGALDILVTRMT
jgi:hypothetical protein